MTYHDLTPEQQQKYREVCDRKFGSTICMSETGEPLYFNEEGLMFDTSIVFDLLFNNKNLN